MWPVREGGGGGRKCVQDLLRKLVGMRQRGRSGSRWEGNIKEVFKETLLESVNWIHLAEVSGQRLAVVNVVTNFPQCLWKFRVPYFLGVFHEQVRNE